MILVEAIFLVNYLHLCFEQPDSPSNTILKGVFRNLPELRHFPKTLGAACRAIYMFPGRTCFPLLCRLFLSVPLAYWYFRGFWGISGNMIPKPLQKTSVIPPKFIHFNMKSSMWQQVFWHVLKKKMLEKYWLEP
jgi:hypothetical protein